MSYEGVFNQIFQPYFYYSVIFLVVSFICVKMSVKYCSFLSRNVRSVISLVPLMIPLFVMLIFVPSTIIQTESILPHIPSGFADWQRNFPFTFSMPHPPPLNFIGPPPFSVTDTLSVTGIICLVGLAIGAFFASTMILSGGKLARKVLHVIDLAPDDYPELQAKINELSGKFAIRTPKVGITEDLRPNAFTIGCGRKTQIVFSIGLLNILDQEEIIAVASHELAHVKSHDFFFKTLSSALTAVSFFNPLAYFASSSAQREREMLADERATKLLEKPFVLGNALAKICGVLKTLPKEGMWATVTSNMLVTSSIVHRPQILAAHPRVDHRLKNISMSASRRHSGSGKMTLAVLLSLLIILGGVAASYAMVSLQVSYMSSEAPKPIDFGAVGSHSFDNRSLWLSHLNQWEMNVSQNGDWFAPSALPSFYARPVFIVTNYNASIVDWRIMPGAFVPPAGNGFVNEYGVVNDTGLVIYR
jgi:Zn-dependent protease with chaperone function